MRVHKVGEATGGDDGPPPSRIAAALARGDLSAALEAYKALPDAARQTGQDWAKAAQGAPSGGPAARGLRADAIERLAATTTSRAKRDFSSLARRDYPDALGRVKRDPMIRLLLFLAALALAAYGLTWLAETRAKSRRPGAASNTTFR